MSFILKILLTLLLLVGAVELARAQQPVTVTNSFLLDTTLTGRFASAFASADNIAAQTSTAVHGLMMGWDGAGSNWDRLQLDTSGFLKVNLAANAFGTLTVQGTGTFDVSDRAARLVGVVYGSQAQPLKQTATNFNLASELATGGTLYDARQIRALTSADTVTVTDGAGALNVIVDSGSVTATNAFLLDATYTGRMPAGASPANGESNTNTALSRIGTYPYIFNGSTWDRWTGAVSGTVAVSSAFLLDATYTGRMPAGASPADAETNTNTALSRIGGYLFGYNGTTWDRLQVDASKFLKVNVQACTGCGLSATDGGAFTSGASAFTPVGGEYDPSATPLTSGQQGTQALTAYRSGYSTLYGSNALELGTTLNPVNVRLGGISSIIANSPLIDPTQATVITLDPFGQLKSTSTVTDGSGRNAALRGPEGAQIQDAGLVVQPSIAPALQCPYVQAFSQTASATIVTNAGGKMLHICWFGVVSATAQSFSLVEGTGTTCATGIKALYGSTAGSAALSANGGLHGISDRITLPMQVNGDNLCVVQTGAGNLSGTIVYGIY